MLTSLVLKQRRRSRGFTRSINAGHKSNKNIHNNLSSVFFSLLYAGGPSLLNGWRYKWLDLTLGRTRSGSRYVIGNYSPCFTLRNRIPEFNKKRKHTIVSGSNIYLALNMPFLPPLKFKWITTCMILSSETPFLAYAYICFLIACIFFPCFTLSDFQT